MMSMSNRKCIISWSECLRTMELNWKKWDLHTNKHTSTQAQTQATCTHAHITQTSDDYDRSAYEQCNQIEAHIRTHTHGNAHIHLLSCDTASFYSCLISFYVIMYVLGALRCKCLHIYTCNMLTPPFHSILISVVYLCMFLGARYSCTYLHATSVHHQFILF